MEELTEEYNWCYTALPKESVIRATTILVAEVINQGKHNHNLTVAMNRPSKEKVIDAILKEVRPVLDVEHIVDYKIDNKKKMILLKYVNWPVNEKKDWVPLSEHSNVTTYTGFEQALKKYETELS